MCDKFHFEFRKQCFLNVEKLRDISIKGDIEIFKKNNLKMRINKLFKIKVI